MERKIIILLIVFLIISSFAYADEPVPHDYYEYIGNPEAYKDYNVLTNFSFNPYEDPKLLNQLLYEGFSPSAIVVQRIPRSYPRGNGKGVFYYDYEYYCFYGDFKDDKFIVRDDYYSIGTNSTGALTEKVAVKTNVFKPIDNEYQGKILKYTLEGFNFVTNSYNTIKFKYIYDVPDISVLHTVPYKYGFGGLNKSYLFYTPENKQLFYYGNGSPFYLGQLQGPSKTLEMIPQMVMVAVVFLVGLISLLIVLKVFLKEFRIFLSS